MKITFTVNELKSLPEDVLNKLLKFTEQAEADIAKANDRKDQAITAYNELENEFKLQKTLVRDQATKIATLENEFITVKDHNEIFNGLKNHFETLLLEQKAETTRVDDLLFIQEEDNKKYRKEVKELNEDLKTRTKTSNFYKKQAKTAEATSSLLARKLVESDWQPKRKQPKTTTVNIGNYFNINANSSIDKQIEHVIEVASNSIASGNEVIVDRSGLYSPRK